jgi:hypothetical protein
MTCQSIQPDTRGYTYDAIGNRDAMIPMCVPYSTISKIVRRIENEKCQIKT